MILHSGDTIVASRGWQDTLLERGVSEWLLDGENKLPKVLQPGVLFWQQHRRHHGQKCYCGCGVIRD
jgi:hypothetical protein